MDKKIRFENILLILLSICVVLLVYSNINSENKTKKPEILEVGDKIDNFELIDEANLIKIDFMKQEKPIILFIYAEGCEVCLKNSKVWIDHYYKNNKKFDIYFLYVDKSMKMKELLQKNNIFANFKVSDEVKREMKINAVPIVYLFDSIGTVQYSFLGASTADETEKFNFKLKNIY